MFRGGESFYSWSQDKTVRFWRIDQALEKEYRVKRIESFFRSVEISPDRQQFLALLNRHNAEIYSIHGNLNKSIKLVDTVESMQFSSDGQKLITYSKTSAQLLDLSGNLIARLPAKALDISSNGKHIIVGLLDGIGQLLNADSKVIKTSLIRDTSSITAVVFSPDGNRIATGCNHSHIHLWTIDGRQVTTLELDDAIQPLAQRGRGVVESLLFSKDGRKLYASLRVQHSRGYVNKGFVLEMNKGLKFEVSGDGLVFSPDGQKILDFSFNTAKLLNADGKLLHEYDADHLASAAFSKDGKTIIAIFKDGLVRLWKIHVTVDEFLARNEIESLTKEERDEYGIE